MNAPVRSRLGDRLLAKGVVTKEQLEVALKEQIRAHRPLGEILLSLGFVTAEVLARLVAEDMGLPFLRGSEVEPDPLLVSALDAAFVRETLAFPIELKDGELLVLMADPDDPAKVSAVRSRFPYPLRIAITTEGDVRWLLGQYVRGETARTAQVFADLAQEGLAEVPVERLTQAVILDGVYRGATDIHIEPDPRVTRVRYRIDGILHPGENLPTEATAAVVSRVKILAGLDISERRRPQDGRIRFNVDERQVDLRVSIMPTTDGENVVIRILDAQGSSRGQLDSLGIASEQTASLKLIAQRSHGLFLVTGPTGSGKTTTLYSLLGEVDAMGRNVATIEDPVEYRLPLLRQSQVDTAIGFGFNEGLRALLRQDPDVILVGEIRDAETAQMAIKASMTGHLVFSTLHTNSALGAIPRLIDIGVDAFLIEDSLIGVLAQRLVRRICRGCATTATLSDADRRWLGDDHGTPLVGSGCDRCRRTGYSGRTVISELFLPDEETAEAIRSGADLTHLRKLAAARGLVSMNDDGRAKVRAGITTRAEVERVNRSHRLDDDERGHRKLTIT